MEAYFDEKLKRWVFPGDDLAELAKPLPPPPTSLSMDISGQENVVPLKLQNEVQDPLSSLLAPPSLRITGGHALKKGTASSSSIVTQPPIIPQFSIFHAKGDEIKDKDQGTLEL